MIGSFWVGWALKLSLSSTLIFVLTISTVLAVIFAANKSNNQISLQQVFPSGSLNIAFLVAFMGWMPAPLDISIWQSIWTLEKKKKRKTLQNREIIFDFNIGYITTIFLGICFMSLGFFVMYGTNQTFSSNGGVFASQLISLYTQSIGEGVFIIIAIAAFTTMFSTTITCLDASPRAMKKTFELLRIKQLASYKLWIVILSIGTSFIFVFMMSEMGFLVKVATILSFITAPFYAIINHVLIYSKHNPEINRPKKSIEIFSISGIVFLSCFTVWYLTLII